VNESFNLEKKVFGENVSNMGKSITQSLGILI